MKIKLSLVCLTFMAVLPACTSTNPQAERAKIGRFAKENDSEIKLKRAQSLHDMGEFEAAISQMRTLIDSSSYSAFQDKAYELLIEWLIEVRKENEAKRYASYFLANHKTSPSIPKIIALFNRRANPEKQPDLTAPPAPPAHETPKDDNNDENLIIEIQKTSQGHKIPPPAGLSGAQLAFHYFHLGDLSKAYDVSAKSFINAPPQTQNQLTLLQKKIDNLRAVDMSAIGILLPLSGPFAAFGKKALTAMSIAFATPLPLTDPKINVFQTKGLKIIVADSAADLGRIDELIDTLAIHYKTAIIIGEMTTEPSVAAAVKSHQYGIPILSLSRHPVMTNLSKNVFIFNASPTQQIDHLVNYAIKEQKHSNFAIIYPRHNYGIALAKNFYESVLKNNGHITAMESYDTHETNFNETARKLVGTQFMSARSEYTTCEKQAQNESIKSTRDAAIKLCKESLKPIINFDAIFVPEFQSLSFLVPALVQEDILLTNNPLAKKSYAATTKIDNPQTVQMLGPSSWNDDTVLSRLATQVNGAVFVDAVNKLSPEMTAFKQAFSALNSQMPSSIEVFAHDAAKLSQAILRDLAADPQIEKSRLAVQQRLASFNKKVGLLENISFASNQELVSPLISFEIMNGQAKPLVTNSSTTSPR